MPTCWWHKPLLCTRWWSVTGTFLTTAFTRNRIDPQGRAPWDYDVICIRSIARLTHECLKDGVSGGMFLGQVDGLEASLVSGMDVCPTGYQQGHQGLTVEGCGYVEGCLKVPLPNGIHISTYRNIIIWNIEIEIKKLWIKWFSKISIMKKWCTEDLAYLNQIGKITSCKAIFKTSHKILNCFI